jgi:oxygen-independent coproporphyrinogen-3 oxidase
MPDEQKQAEQFEMLMDEAAKNNFLHYEISNFCKEGFHSQHNCSYWQDEHYLGLGPSAHSYNGFSRQWNIAGNSAYMIAVKNGKPFFESEMLDANKKYNEYVMTSLRTMWGCNVDYIIKNFGNKFSEYFSKAIKRFEAQDELTVKNGTFVLTRKGKLFADRIASELFFTDRL